MIQWFMKGGSFFWKLTWNWPLSLSGPAFLQTCPTRTTFIYVFCVQEYFLQMIWPCSQYYKPFLRCVYLLRRVRHVCMHACVCMCVSLCVSTMWVSTPVNHNCEISDKPWREGLEGDKTGRKHAARSWHHKPQAAVQQIYTCSQYMKTYTRVRYM